METTVFSINVNQVNILSTISLTAIDKANYLNSSFGTLAYKAETELETYRIIFSFNTEINKLELSVEFAPSLKASCLILCGIALMGPILDCYKKNTGNWQGFKECLEEQGHTLGTSSLACIAACI